MKLNLDNWESIPPIVEAIIAAREIPHEIRHWSGGVVTATMQAARKMRFRDFATEAGINYYLAHRVIRCGVKPSEENKKLVVAWCKKHAKHIQK